jgi:hypothetical protein
MAKKQKIEDVSMGEILECLFDPYKTENVNITFTDGKVIITGESLIKKIKVNGLLENEKFDFVGTSDKDISQSGRKSNALDAALKKFKESKFYISGTTGELWCDSR